MTRNKPSSLAKLTRPQVRGAILRERLFALLDQAHQAHPACCVVAPPGSGTSHRSPSNVLVLPNQLTAPSPRFEPIPTYAILCPSLRQSICTTSPDSRDAFSASCSRAFRQAELHLAQAYAALRHSNDEQAFTDSLRQALAFAREVDYIFGFRCVFRAHRMLFNEALRLGIEPLLVTEIIRRFNIRLDAQANESWPWPVKVYTLGKFQVIVHDHPLAHGRKAPRKVLGLPKCIVALGTSDVPDHRVIDALWPEEDGAAARHAFRIALHRLRRALGSPDSVLHEDGQLSLNRRWIWVDTVSFEQTANTTTQRDAAEALRLYRGEFLPQEIDAPWTAPLRHRLNVKYLSAMKRAGASSNP